VTYRDYAALAAEADDCVVGAGPAGGGVDDDEHLLVFHEREGLDGEEVVDVYLAEDLLEAVEGEARELGLDEVRAVLRAKKKHMTQTSGSGHVNLNESTARN
jgi:hypothetical protein